MKEPADVVMIPLYALAALAIFGGLFGFPQAWGDLVSVQHSNSLANFLEPIFPASGIHDVDHSMEYRLAASAVGTAGTGALLAWLLYVVWPDLPARIARRSGFAFRTLVNKYWVDEIYDALVVRPLVFLSDRVFYRAIDAGLIDGVTVNGSARLVRGVASHGLKYVQNGLAQSYLFLMIVGALAIVGYLVR